MAHTPGTPQWIHRGCHVELVGCRASGAAYRIRHASGLPLGSTASLAEARHVIDEGIDLLRQRLAARV
jgi:hypothetical protein